MNTSKQEWAVWKLIILLSSENPSTKLFVNNNPHIVCTLGLMNKSILKNLYLESLHVFLLLETQDLVALNMQNSNSINYYHYPI